MDVTPVTIHDVTGNDGQSGTPPERRLRCLLVDDDPFLRMLIVDILRDLGHEPIEAPDPDTALSLLQNDSVDVLLTDISLPFMDGAELATRARQRHPDLRVIFATAHSATKLPGLATDPNARYLRKPFGQKELSQTLQSLTWDD